MLRDKMNQTVFFVLVTLFITAFGQRSPYAGKRPIGFPAMETTSSDPLGNRLGESDVTTVRMPIEALGDRDLVNRLSKLPLDQQPFWLINWRAIEEHRKNFQNYPQKINTFIERNAVLNNN